jgi:glycosyltransferase involved in cell wall biosynthesis
MTEQPYPKISVITCTYNSQAFLQKALASVENQAYRNLEHIINDSHSTDATLAILQDYVERVQGQYPVKLIQSEPQGVGNALNVATREATGDIIHYLHSDDYYLDPGALARVAGHFNQNPNLVWLTGNFVVEFKGRRIILPQTLILQPSLEIALSMMNFISHENTFMRTRAVEQYGGFNETKDDVVEYSLWLKLLRDHRPLIVNDEFCVFIIHKGSTSTGNVFRLMKAVRRAFHTQRKEHVLPIVGYYQERRSYRSLMVLIKRIADLRYLLHTRML